MNTPRTQFIIFTGLDGSLFQPPSRSLREVQTALDLINTKNIPFVIATDQTADAVFDYLKILGRDCPFIAESGAAIYIPRSALTVGYHFHRTHEDFNVIEFGTQRESILERLTELRGRLSFSLVCFSEASRKQLKNHGLKLSSTEFEEIRSRIYSEVVVFDINRDRLEALNTELEKVHLRIKEHDDYLIITGDHDEGTAVRFLVQLYREEFPDCEITTVGLGARWMDAPTLYAVDKPVLIRQLDGRFDERIGRREMKFTRNPGPVGWNQAVVALLTGTEE